MDDNEDDSANFFISDDKTCKLIQEKQAESISASLCLTSDKTMLMEVVQKFKRPANIPNQRQPKLNQEIKIKRAGVKFREARLCKIQTCIERGIAGIFRIMHEAKSGLKD